MILDDDDEVVAEGIEGEMIPEGEEGEAGMKPGAQGEPETEPGEKPEGEEPEGQKPEGETPAEPEPTVLTQKGKEAIEKRFGVLTRKAKEAEEKAAELEARLSGATFEDGVTGLPFPSEFVQPDEVKLLGKAAELKGMRKALRPFRDEGYEGADGKTYTASQVRARLDDIEEELETVGPKAAVIRARAETAFQEEMKAFRAWRKAGKPGAAAEAAAGGKKPETSMVDEILGKVMMKKKTLPTAPASAGRSAGATSAGGAGGKNAGASSWDKILEDDDPDAVRKALRKRLG